jgi:tRNA(Leu) C34 or U34 (ribose-2'-O)-methylase TrmL
MSNANQPMVIIGLTNPKTPENIGAVMRAAGCFGAHEVRYTGERYARAARFHTDTRSISLDIPLTGVDNLLEAIPEDTRIVCVELAEGATALPAFEHPQRAIYIFGPEDGSLHQKDINRADAVVYIPTRGCLNLAATVNIVLFDRQAKAGLAVSDDQLIRDNRDTNNRLKVPGP